MASTHGKRPDDASTRPGNTPVEQQERDPRAADSNRPERLAISGPGAADFLAAPGGLDLPGSDTTKGMGATRDEGPLSDPTRLVPRLGPDVEPIPGEPEAPNGRQAEQLTGSQTGTIGGGGPEAHNPSPIRATGVDDPT